METTKLLTCELKIMSEIFVIIAGENFQLLEILFKAYFERLITDNSIILELLEDNEIKLTETQFDKIMKLRSKGLI
jgi:hypothetical protein